MSEDNWTMQISLKTGGQTLINIRGSNHDELLAGLAVMQSLAEEITTTEVVLGTLQPLGAHTTPTAVSAAPPAAPQAPPAQAPAPAGPAPTCDHGLPAKFVPGGISQKSRQPYPAFWACAQDRALQCSFRANA